MARAYLKDLGPDEVAAELGLGDPKELTARIQASARLRELGLAPLLPARRDQADRVGLARRAVPLAFQEVARELELGTPFRSF